jgi:prophage DNA circulation protein
MSGEITSIPNTIWRDQYMPATFKGARFHCEANAIESGRRIVQHEFPKKELPWAEDMGRAAASFTIRGYCIAYPFDADEFWQRDYRTARNRLAKALNELGAGMLELPTYRPLMVVCMRYRLTEEERFGGYCVFDMTFTEQGVDPQQYVPGADTAGQVGDASEALRNQVQRTLAPPSTPARVVSA